MIATVTNMGGHLFIINGDLTKVACDALLIPTDSECKIEDHWLGFLESRGYTKPDAWKLGDVFLSASDKTPHIWLGNVGQPISNSAFKAFAPTLEAFVDHAIAALRAVSDCDRIYPWPKTRLAVNVVGSGRGGGREKKGELTRGLIKTLTHLAESCDVDIILVTKGQKPYAAAQCARRLTLAERAKDQTWPLGTELQRQAQTLANAAIDEHLVLFIGAGVSASAGLPLWGDLLMDIAKTAGFEEDSREKLRDKDLRDQATLIERALSQQGKELRELVKNELVARRHYSLVHGLLASLPSREAITTNFDDLFETASGNIAVLPRSPRETKGRWLLKLHGGVQDHKNIVLTRSDFLNMPRQYGALMGLVQGLLMMRTMVFVGYSLMDEDFHELIDEVRIARGEHHGATKDGVVLTLKDDALDRQLWGSDLNIVSMTVDSMLAPGDIAGAAYRLELFLDLVGYLATTSASFFLDQTYSDLSVGEADLLKPLNELAALTAASAVGSVGHEVRNFLEKLGAATEPSPTKSNASENMSQEYVSQPVRPGDLRAGQVRLPTASKVLFPDCRTTIRIAIRGQTIDARWDPRNGPDRRRSGVLVVRLSFD